MRAFAWIYWKDQVFLSSLYSPIFTHRKRERERKRQSLGCIDFGFSNYTRWIKRSNLSTWNSIYRPNTRERNKLRRFIFATSKWIHLCFRVFFCCFVPTIKLVLESCFIPPSAFYIRWFHIRRIIRTHTKAYLRSSIFLVDFWYLLFFL